MLPFYIDYKQSLLISGLPSKWLKKAPRSRFSCGQFSSSGFLIVHILCSSLNIYFCFIRSLPHVVTVCLKNNAQIEVVVSNRERALQESEELHQDIFEVVEAMAMHLM